MAVRRSSDATARRRARDDDQPPVSAEAAAAHIHAVVCAIPRGRVASYGQVAQLAGLPGRARLVGRVLAQLPVGSRVPWQRVLNASGRISTSGECALEQRRLLEREGVRFEPSGRVDLRRYGLAA